MQAVVQAEHAQVQALTSLAALGCRISAAWGVPAAPHCEAESSRSPARLCQLPHLQGACKLTSWSVPAAALCSAAGGPDTSSKALRPLSLSTPGMLLCAPVHHVLWAAGKSLLSSSTLTTAPAALPWQPGPPGSKAWALHQHSRSTAYCWHPMPCQGGCSQAASCPVAAAAAAAQTPWAAQGQLQLGAVGLREEPVEEHRAGGRGCQGAGSAGL